MYAGGCARSQEGSASRPRSPFVQGLTNVFLPLPGLCMARAGRQRAWKPPKEIETMKMKPINGSTPPPTTDLT